MTAPKYEQIRDRLLDEFGHGEDLRLPSERELAKQFDVSRMTIRQAISALAVEGRVNSRHGVGTYISRQPIAKNLSLTSFSQDMIARGLTPGSRLISATEVPASVPDGDALGLAPDEHVYVVERLRTANDSPMCIERVTLPTKVVPGLLEENLENSLYEILLMRYRIRIALVEQEMRAVLLRGADAELLGVPSRSPALLVARVGRDGRGRLIELASSLYRGDRYSFSATLRREQS